MRSPALGMAEPSKWQLAIYGITILPMTLGQQPLIFIVPYYSTVFGLGIAALGLWLTIGRIFDIVADLSVGYFSDRFRSRWGRRPWVLVGLTLFVPAGWLLFVPGQSMSIERFAIGLLLFFLTWTIGFIPYLVHGTEIATGHVRRAAINVLQGMGTSTALLVSYAGPLLFASAMFGPWRDGVADLFTGTGWSMLDGVATMLRESSVTGVESYGIVMLVIVLMMTLITPPLLLGYALWVPEGRAPVTHGSASALAAFRNVVFLRFSLGFLLLVSAYFITLFLLPFMLSYLYEEPGQMLNLMLVMTVTQVVAAPGWYFVLSRWERKNTLLAAAMVQAFSLVLFMITPAHNVPMLYLCHIAFGATGQTLMMVPFLIASDSADYSLWKTGRDSRAVHISLISLLIKAGSVSGALFVSLVGLAQLDPTRQVQPSSALIALQGLGLYAPCLFLLIGGAIVWTHPITRNRQSALQRRIDLRAFR